jgi:AcrR family transcriptional regulator
MAKKKENSTRESLLKAAVAVFARKGYHAATIAEICKPAGANIAAVNYHFGDKETLYKETWRKAFHQSLKKFAPDGGVKPNAPAEEQFYGRILALLLRFSDPQNYAFEIMQKEMTNPTRLLHDVLRESVEPLRQDFSGIVRRLLGPKCGEKQVSLCMMSVYSQCFDVTIGDRHRKVFARAGAKPGPRHEKVSIEETAEHIAQFSLAGIREIRRRAEQRQRQKQ